MQLQKTLWLVAVILCGSTAFADIELKTLLNAVEASPANIILPATTNGMMTYRGCADDCELEYERARLTDSTSFTINGKPAKFAEFRAVHSELRLSDETYALVTVDLALGTVTNITLER